MFRCVRGVCQVKCWPTNRPIHKLKTATNTSPCCYSLQPNRHMGGFVTKMLPDWRSLLIRMFPVYDFSSDETSSNMPANKEFPPEFKEFFDRFLKFTRNWQGDQKVSQKEIDYFFTIYVYTYIARTSTGMYSPAPYTARQRLYLWDEANFLKQEGLLSEAFTRDLTKTNAAKSDERTTRLNKIMSTLVTGNQLESELPKDVKDIQIVIQENTSKNLPRSFQNGCICVPKDTVEQHNDDELSHILGHELAHILTRHRHENYCNDIFVKLYAIHLYGFLDDLKLSTTEKTKQDWVEQKLEILREHIQLDGLYKNDFLHEDEADKLSMIWMKSAGFDAAKAVGVWEKKIPASSKVNKKLERRRQHAASKASEREMPRATNKQIKLWYQKEGYEEQVFQYLTWPDYKNFPLWMNRIMYYDTGFRYSHDTEPEDYLRRAEKMDAFLQELK